MIFVRRNPTSQPSGGETPPFPFTGNLVLTDGNEREEELVARFAEELWGQNVGDDFALSFAPAPTRAYFWVSAATQERVDGILSWGLDNLIHAFMIKGLTLEEF